MGVLDTFRLDGRVALVTGGSRGLGLQIAEALGEAGASLAITARREPGLSEGLARLKERGFTATSTVCDISKNDQVEAAVQAVLDQFGHIDILVNNAGATWGAPLEDIPRRDPTGSVAKGDTDKRTWLPWRPSRNLALRGRPARSGNGHFQFNDRAVRTPVRSTMNAPNSRSKNPHSTSSNSAAPSAATTSKEPRRSPLSSQA